VDDLKVEGPLTPPKPTLTAPKTVRFSEMVEEMDLDPPSPVNSPTTKTFFQDAFGEAAEKVKQQLEQETLVDADTTARVEVRTMESVATKPPWQRFQDCKSSTELLALQMEAMRSISAPTKWAGVSYPHIQEKLRYNPFPHELAKVALEEIFEGTDATWEIFVEDSKDEEIIDSLNLTWKPPGLRILNIDDDDDDDVELGTFAKDQPRDISFLVKKRKLELDQHNGDTERAMQRHGNVPNVGTETAFQAKQPPRRNTSKPNDFVTAGQQMELDQLEEPGLLLGGQFSAENMLENFMELRGVKKPKLMDSSYIQNKAAKDPPSVPRNPTPAMPAGVDLTKYGRGFEMVQRMGWKAGDGLSAPNNQGPASPIKAHDNRKRRGIGWGQQEADVQLPVRLSPAAKQSPLPAPTIISGGAQNAIVCNFPKHFISLFGHIREF
jgi:hypothetical protein